MPVDRSDDRLTEVPNTHQGIKIKLDVTVPVGFIARRIALQCLRVQVKASRKCPPTRASEHNYTDIFISLKSIQDITQFSEEGLGESVVLLRPIEGDRGNSIALLAQQVLVGHGVLLPIRGL